MKAVVALLVVVLVAAAQAKTAEASQEVSIGAQFLSNILNIPQCVVLSLIQGVLSLFHDALLGCLSSGLSGAFACAATNAQGIIADVLHSLETCNTH